MSLVNQGLYFYKLRDLEFDITSVLVHTRRFSIEEWHAMVREAATEWENSDEDVDMASYLCRKYGFELVTYELVAEVSDPDEITCY